MTVRWPMPPTLLVASVTAMAGLHLLLPGPRWLASPWRWLGVAPIALGVVWNLWADRLFKRHRTTVKPHRAPTSLVCSGPFRISRNPMYVGMVAIAAGVAVLLGTVAPLIVLAAFTGILAGKFVPMEEQAMAEAFGDAWDDYRRRVRRWL